MRVIFKTPLSERVQLAPQNLMPGESISSLVDRQAQQWGITRSDLVYQVANLHGTLANKDLDVSKYDTFLSIYSEKTGIGREVLEAHRAQRSQVLLRPTRRYAYCPICFEEDLLAGHIPYFRLDWARIFLTHCRKHRCPLFDWPRVAADGTRLLPSAWFLYSWLTKRKPHGAKYRQCRDDLALATQYSPGSQRLCQPSAYLWHRLVAFEELMYQENVGPPTHSRNGTGNVFENNLVKKAGLLKRSAIASGKPSIPREIHFKDRRVMDVSIRSESLHRGIPSWGDLRHGWQSMPHRRAFMLNLAYTCL